MAHTQIKGLASYPFDVDFLSQETMVCIEGEFGAKGAMMTVALLCAIYRNGYYVEWQAGLKYRLRREMGGVSPQLLEMVVRTLVRRGFFCKDLFDSDSILTSPDIQRRYFRADGASAWSPDLPYLLLPEDVFSSGQGDACLPAPSEGSLRGGIPPTPPLHRLPDNNIINNYNLSKTMEGKEYGGAGEKEKPSAAPAGNIPGEPEKKNVMADFIAELKDSPQWLEQMGIRNRLSLKDLYGWLDDYLSFCECEGKVHGSLREVKSHFNRWLPKRIEYQNNKNRSENETVREDRFARRRGTDTKARSASDYSTSF